MELIRDSLYFAEFAVITLYKRRFSS